MPTRVRVCKAAFIVPLLLLMGALMAVPALADGRTALIIGNSAYPSAPLKNPVNDAGDMAAALQKLGFEVTLLRDVSMQQMEEAVRAFGLKLRQGGAGLFYYAGHGVQVAGENYLVPVNAVIQTEGDVKYGCLNAGLVLAKMEDAGNGPNVVILDACRNNPFARSFRSAAQGLARMDAPTGSIIAYATAPGQVASDGEGRNGLYTQYLLRNIATPGLSIGDLFMNVREGVVRASGKKQVPWENTSLIGRFSLAGPVSPATPAPSVPAPTASAQPAPAQLVPALKAPTPDEARLLQYMRLAWSAKHEEEREKARALAAPLAAKGSVYGKYALGWLSEDNMAQYQAERQAAAQGVPLAMVHLAETLSDKAVSPEDAVEARDWLKRAMALGEPRAKVALGVMLAKGQGGAKDLAGGTRMLAEAAREHPEFNLLVGVSFGDLEKDGVTDAKARELAYVRRGAELGDVNAMMQMGHNYENGWGVAKNAREAVWWFTKAADTGFPYAMFYLGALLRNGGDKLPADPITAAKWFARGAALGETACTIQLAQMTLEGEGVARDAQKGLGLLRGLADTGNGFAQVQLGQVYEMGRGVPQNPAEAYFWYVVADNSGDMGGAIWRKSLAQKLSPAQRAEIEARAAKWKPRDKKK